MSRLAANLISEKYQLSKYHTKYRELEQEEDKLDQLVIRELYAFKDAYVLSQIKEIQAQIKSMQNNEDMDQVFELMKKLTRLNEIKNISSTASRPPTVALSVLTDVNFSRKISTRSVTCRKNAACIKK